VAVQLEHYIPLPQAAKRLKISAAVNLKSGFYATKVTDEKGKCDNFVVYS
jgi:hypothetical protein